MIWCWYGKVVEHGNLEGKSMSPLCPIQIGQVWCVFVEESGWKLFWICLHFSMTFVKVSVLSVAHQMCNSSCSVTSFGERKVKSMLLLQPRSRISMSCLKTSTPTQVKPEISPSFQSASSQDISFLKNDLDDSFYIWLDFQRKISLKFMQILWK